MLNTREYREILVGGMSRGVANRLKQKVLWRNGNDVMVRISDESGLSNSDETSNLIDRFIK